MTEEDSGRNAPSARSWLGRISQVLWGDAPDQASLIESLREAQEEGIIDADAVSMMEGVLQVSQMQVRDIMIPRAQMVVLEREATYEKLLPVIIESGHSRFPVIGENRDEVVGILLAKDLLRFYGDKSGQRFSLRELIRPATFIPESKRLNVLLKEFRTSRNHIAMIVDEYGGVSGLVTIEDVLEQIVGDIDDEHDLDDDSDNILRYTDSRFVVKALTPVDDFNEYFDTTLSEEEFDTIGGLVMNKLGHLPGRGEAVVIDRFLFTVMRADSRRIHLLQVTLNEPSAR